MKVIFTTDGTGYGETQSCTYSQTVADMEEAREVVEKNLDFARQRRCQTVEEIEPGRQWRIQMMPGSVYAGGTFSIED